MAGAASPDRTAIRLPPGSLYADIDEGPEGPELYRRLLANLNDLGLVYLHLVHNGDEPRLADLRRIWRGALMVNRAGGGGDRIGRDVAAGAADMESSGR